MYRNTYLQIDLDVLENNIKFFQEHSRQKLIGVVKANGYGLIDYVEAETLASCGCDFFAVSSLDEALVLRSHGIKGKILILGYVPPVGFRQVRDHDLSLVSVSRKYVEENDLSGISMHLKLNTGMNRLGILPQDAAEVLQIMREKGANVEGVMSHFSSADEDQQYSQAQYDLFKKTVESLDYDFTYIHMAATDGSLIIADDFCTHQRIGLGLLGFDSWQAQIKPCVKLFSEVVMIKQLKPGDTVSYGRHYTSDGHGFLLTLPIGYADGFYRANTGKEVFVENEYGRIVGSICMDQMMVLCDHYHPEGSRVEIFGEHVDITKRAKELGTITYELLTSLSDRISRRYISNGEIVNMIDPRF